MKAETRYILLGAVVLAILFIVVAFVVQGDDASTKIAINKLKIATGFTLLGLVFLFGFAVLVYIANGSIDLSDLLSETGDSKGASMSRFQLLIFTLVIALSLFLVTVSDMKFPDKIPPEILTLLGISASTYAVSKGIQASTDNSTDGTGGNNTTTTTTTTSTTAPPRTPMVTLPPPTTTPGPPPTTTPGPHA